MAIPTSAKSEWPGLEIDQTGLPQRLRNLLVNAGFTIIGEVAAKSDAELLALPCFGPRIVKRLRAEIERLGDAEGQTTRQRR